MHYNTEALPEGVTEESLSIAYWNGPEWLILEGTVDTENNKVSVNISHLTGFVVMYEQLI